MSHKTPVHKTHTKVHYLKYTANYYILVYTDFSFHI